MKIKSLLVVSSLNVSKTQSNFVRDIMREFLSYLFYWITWFALNNKRAVFVSMGSVWLSSFWARHFVKIPNISSRDSPHWGPWKTRYMLWECSVTFLWAIREWDTCTSEKPQIFGFQWIWKWVHKIIVTFSQKHVAISKSENFFFFIFYVYALWTILISTHW